MYRGTVIYQPIGTSLNVFEVSPLGLGKWKIISHVQEKVQVSNGDYYLANTFIWESIEEENKEEGEAWNKK